MEYTDVIIIPIIMALSELLKRTGFNAKFIPIVSLILGVIAGITYLYPTDIKAGILYGLMMGLSASGLYSGTKNVAEQLRL
jgi:L-cystine uptake protein TcyP (sodium:dicarboxylate symporter family)